MVIGLNIVSVLQNDIKVLWCCLYTVLSWEIEADLIVFEHQRRRRICFNVIVTPHETQHLLSLANLIFPVIFFSFLVIFPFSIVCFFVYLRPSL